MNCGWAVDGDVGVVEQGDLVGEQEIGDGEVVLLRGGEEIFGAAGFVFGRRATAEFAHESERIGRDELWGADDFIEVEDQRIAEQGLFAALGEGVFGDVPRAIDEGRGTEGIVELQEGYFNPARELMQGASSLA